MDLDKLRITKPLGLQSSIETEWVKVSSYKFLRLTSCSDTNVTIEVIFSHNASDIGPSNNLKQGKLWMTCRVDILLDWMKIKVTNEQTIENKFLIINCLGRHNVGPLIDVHDLPKPFINDNEPVVESQEESRSKSPFKSILKSGFKSKKKPDFTKSVSFDRLPTFIPRNGVLVGSFNNQIQFIPPPPIDKMSFLVSNNGVIQWIEFQEGKYEWTI